MRQGLRRMVAMNRQATLDDFGLVFDNCYCDMCEEIKDNCKAFPVFPSGWLYVCDDCLAGKTDWEVADKGGDSDED